MAQHGLHVANTRDFHAKKNRVNVSAPDMLIIGVLSFLIGCFVRRSSFRLSPLIAFVPSTIKSSESFSIEVSLSNFDYILLLLSTLLSLKSLSFANLTYIY